MAVPFDREPIRQRGRAAVCLAMLTFATVACAGDPAPTATPAPAAATANDAGDASGDASPFPVTIEHKYGETTIEAPPQRVVAVGLTDQDALIALGTVPVGAQEWFGDAEAGIWPWAEERLDGADRPTVVGGAGGIDFEQIAALRPDLIVALYSGISQSEHDTLAQIAPVVAQPGDRIDWGISWQEQTITVGRILGREDRARQLVDDVEQQIADAKAAHPEFTGAEGVVVSPMSTSKAAIFTDQDPRGRFLTELGFTRNPALAEEADEGYTVDIGLERLDLIADADVVVWLLGDVETNGKLLESVDVYTASAVFREGRGVYVASDTGRGGASSFVTVLSIPVLLEDLVPRLAAAVDGDPATPA